MPELPEVETIRSYLDAKLSGLTAERFILKREDIFIIDQDDLKASMLEGRKLLSISRKGKFLRLAFAEGLGLIIHLGMTGKLLYFDKTDEASQLIQENKHTHAIFDFGNSLLFFNDVRRFGFMRLYRLNSHASDPYFSRLGPDALNDDLNLDDLYEKKIRHAKLKLKAFLLDQSIISGLGNIYTDEVLFKAGLRPGIRMNRISRKDLARLIPIIKSVIRHAVEEGGTSFRDYRNASNLKGNYQNFLAVYGKAGQSCPICGSELCAERVAGRSSTYCPCCQKNK